MEDTRLNGEDKSTKTILTVLAVLVLIGLIYFFVAGSNNNDAELQGDTDILLENDLNNNGIDDALETGDDSMMNDLPADDSMMGDDAMMDDESTTEVDADVMVN